MDPKKAAERLDEVVQQLPVPAASKLKLRKPSPLGTTVNDLLAKGRTEEAAAVSLDAFLQPPRYKATAAQLAVLSQATVSSIHVDGHDLKTYTWPSRTTRTSDFPQTLILSHGFSTSAALMTPLIAHLHSTTPHRLVAIDHIAHGASPGSTASLGTFISTLQALTRAPENQPLRGIIGHSVGGTAAIMALAADAALLPSPGSEPFRLVLLSPPLQATTLFTMFCGGHGVQAARVVPTMRELWTPSAETVMREGLAGKLEGVRVLVVQDEGDAVAPIGEARALVSSFAEATATLETTEGLGHFKGVGDERVLKLVDAFVA